ncbi:MAG: linear amide C-N hydrolase [Desulfobacterales bacterium]|nr:linear amide C-N hydrolase [Desulfobacterales bacterium]
MRKALKIVTVILLLIPSLAFSCSTFSFTDNGKILFGRSYDWNIGYGYLIKNNRNIRKTTYLPYVEKRAVWTSKYGSITFNQYGREYPIGGMNEKGLVVEVMVLRSSKYPPKDMRPAVSELGYVQYQLDTSASIEDVIDSDKKVRLSNRSFAGIHYLISDSTGKTIAVEFLNGKRVVHSGSGLPYKCLTNNTYQESLKYLKNFEGFSGDKKIDDRYHLSAHSLNRFAIIADIIKHRKKTVSVSNSFEILDKVKDDRRSQFQIVYDIKEMRIHFRSLKAKSIKQVDLAKFDFACNFPVKMFNINTPRKGDISNRFKLYNSKLNRDLVIKAYVDSAIKLPVEELLKIAAFPETFKCRTSKN